MPKVPAHSTARRTIPAPASTVRSNHWARGVAGSPLWYLIDARQSGNQATLGLRGALAGNAIAASRQLAISAINPWILRGVIELGHAFWLVAGSRWFPPLTALPSRDSKARIYSGLHRYMLHRGGSMLRNSEPTKVPPPGQARSRT